jgi:alpha-glucosidase (family GH31 glycosyl hydrolase)
MEPWDYTYGERIILQQGGMMEFDIPDQEYWWYGTVSEGTRMPLTRFSECTVDFGDDTTQNQVSSCLVSSLGRVIYGEAPYRAVFSHGKIRIIGEAAYADGLNDLRGAGRFLYHRAETEKENRRCVPELFFREPQYNTWIELLQDQSQKGVLDYAHGILGHGFPAGVLMIDEGWSPDYGIFEFDSRKFPDPVEMTEELHTRGFKVMLWVTPYISPDSAAFRRLDREGLLLKGADGETAVRKWWNGYSCILDLTNAKSREWLEESLHDLQRRYGIDGFKFDGGDPSMYRDDDRPAASCSARGQVQLYGRFGMEYAFNEFRSGWNSGWEPLVMRLADKRHSWDTEGLNTLIPNSTVQSIFGYVFQCPDMIGGGEAVNFHENAGKLDRELIVRYAETAALFPMMQFSAAPWRILSEEELTIVRSMVILHEKFADTIVNCANRAIADGEPILRHMSWQYPGQGFETTADQFALGEKIVVAPVLKKGARERNVVLPAGTWIDDEGNRLAGGHVFRTEVPLARLPYYTKTD